MASVPPRTERRRARPGSLERPVNGRTYRGTWLLVGLPLLLAAFTGYRPDPLAAPSMPPTFNRDTALKLVHDPRNSDGLADLYPNRPPGPAGALGATHWLQE